MFRAILATTLLVSLAGCATSTQLEVTNKKLDEVTRQLLMSNQQQLQMRAQMEQDKEQAAKKAGPGCFLEGKLYSPGSVVAGRACDDIRLIRRIGDAPEWGWKVNI